MDPNTAFMDAIVALNAGSSSVKFACFGADDLAPVLRGEVDGIGSRTRLKVDGAAGDLDPDANHETAIRHILETVVGPRVDRCLAVGHRIVHGGTRFTRPEIVDDAVLEEIEALSPLARSHQPHNAAGVRAAMTSWPDTPQVACFDTAFHATLPAERQVFAIPYSLADEGVRRYGFHGLSYEGVARALPDLIGAAAQGRVVVAHLGNGASLCGLVAGQSRWTSMGFTPLDGLVMGRRPGRLDPGVLVWLMREKGVDADALDALLNAQSGLLGLSGFSQDMRVLLESDDQRARFAVDVFVDRLVTEIGASAAAIGGCDALVFTGGIGENAAPIRERAVDLLSWLGFTMDSDANQQGAGIISAPSSKPIAIVRADEEATIAVATRDVVRS